MTNVRHAYLVRAAAQGVGMYFASGDASGVETPDDPFTILVGGTSPGIGQHDRRTDRAAGHRGGDSFTRSVRRSDG